MIYDIDIDGPIGPCFYSKEYVREMLAGKEEREVRVRVNSYGGSLNDALDIAQRFRDHGNVTVYLQGFCASAATVLTLGAKRVVMNEYAFYLAHKVSNYVEIVGYLNSDDLEAQIADLGKTMRESVKIDCQVAAMYAAKCGKKPEELRKCMEAAEWMTAKEAKRMGLVDEISRGKEACRGNLADKMNAYHLPVPPLPEQEEPGGLRKFLMGFAAKPKDNKHTIDMAGFKEVKALLNAEALPLDDNRVVLTVEQLERIECRLEEQQRANSEALVKMEELKARQKELTEQVESLKAMPAEQDTRMVEQPAERLTAAQLYDKIKKYI